MFQESFAAPNALSSTLIKTFGSDGRPSTRIVVVPLVV